MEPLIRLALSEDAGEIAAIYRPAVVDTAISFELEPPDAAAMAARLDATLRRTPWIVCRGADGVLGYACATGHRARAAYQWSVEVSAYVRPDMHRAGVGSALYTSLFAVLQLQGFRNAYAGITLPNPASLGLHRAVGFTTIGVYRNVGYKHGAWHDVEWLGRELAPYTAEPQPPTALPEIVGTPALDNALCAGTSRLSPRIPREVSYGHVPRSPGTGPHGM